MKADSGMRRLRWVIAVGAVANLIGTGLFVWTSTEARQHNCDNVEQAFAAYTDALAEVADADPATVAEFRAAYEPELEECH